MRPSRLALLPLFLLLPSPAFSEWLVLRDGTRIETRGAWTLRHATVVFTESRSGLLTSIRRSEVDLTASEELSRPPPSAAPTPAPEANASRPRRLPPPPGGESTSGQEALPAPRRPVLAGQAEPGEPSEPPSPVLRRPLTAPAPAGHATTDTSRPTLRQALPTTEPSSSLTVTAWRADRAGLVLRVTGGLQNLGTERVRELEVWIEVFGPGRKSLGRRRAELEDRSAEPGAVVAFEARFVGVDPVTEVSFELVGQRLRFVAAPTSS